jgi:hypothetical protein
MAAAGSRDEYLALVLRCTLATGFGESFGDDFGSIDFCLHTWFGQITALPSIVSSTRNAVPHFGHRKETAICRSEKEKSQASNRKSSPRP